MTIVQVVPRVPRSRQPFGFAIVHVRHEPGAGVLDVWVDGARIIRCVHVDGDRWTPITGRTVPIDVPAGQHMAELRTRDGQVVAVQAFESTTDPRATRKPPAVCKRCGGTGYLPEYSRVEGGICFACGGAGKGHR